MRANLQKNMEGMLMNLRDQKQFFSNPNIPNSKLVKLLGVERPGPITSIALRPHDQRFKKITIWTKMYEAHKIQSVAFYFPDYPMPLVKVKEMFGEFQVEYVEDRKYSLFKTDQFSEENPIQDFSFVLKGVKMEWDEASKTFTATPLEDPSAVQKVTEDMIWIDNYVFYMKDREPAADPDAKRRKGGLFGM